MRNSNITVRTRRRPPQVKPKETLRAALAEFISTFIFVFAGSGTRIAVNKLTGDAVSGLIASAVAHAFALAAAVSVASVVSGDPYIFRGHVNPAVTFGAFIGGNIHVVRGIIYGISQLLGSIVACLLLMLVTGGQRAPVFGLAGGVGVGNAVVLEMVMTFGLVYTVYATTVDPKAMSKRRKGGLDRIAPLAIGLIVGANILAGGAFDGASMNPALAFGPAVVNWSWGNHWVYWVGPFIGGGLAGFIYDFSFINN